MYLKLYGWTAWWERNTRIQTKPKKHDITEVKKISEAKKRDFITKYYPNYLGKLIVHKSDGIKNDEKFVEGTSHKEDILKIKGRGTPLKRIRIHDDHSIKGETKSTAKRIKFESKVMLRDGTGPSTALQVLGNQYKDLDLGELRPPDKSGILSCGTEVGNN